MSHDAYGGTPFRHEAAFYRAHEEFVGHTVRFVESGVRAGAAAMVAVPGHKIADLRRRLGCTADDVEFVDMAVVGRNPRRIIREVFGDFLAEHREEPLALVGEPVWPERSPAEYSECLQHEALLNLAMSDRTATLVCPYDVTRLSPAVRIDAERTHPIITHNGSVRRSPLYADPAGLAAAVAAEALPEPPVDAERRTYAAGSDLPALRRLVRSFGRRHGLSAGRSADLVVALNELAANTLLHTGGSGTVRLWSDAGVVVCEVSDSGRATDALAGRVLPPSDDEHGRGLVMVNKLCDLVQVRTSAEGSRTRLHVRAR